MNSMNDQLGSDLRQRPFQFSLRALLLVITLVALLLGLGIATLSLVARAFVRDHQQSVARELGEWGREYSRIQSDQDAVRAIDMLRYIEGYYVPGDGYHGDPSTEAAIQTARRKAMTMIVESLERYTGEHAGSDLTKWEAWRKDRTLRAQSGP